MRTIGVCEPAAKKRTVDTDILPEKTAQMVHVMKAPVLVTKYTVQMELVAYSMVTGFVPENGATAAALTASVVLARPFVA